jgi:hypothetical protein
VSQPDGMGPVTVPKPSSHPLLGRSGKEQHHASGASAA